MMSFGLTNAPKSFMIVIIHDILIYLRRDNEHIDRLRIVFQVLNDQQLYAMLRKFEFLLRSMVFRPYTFKKGY